ncbi:hypothetical protein LSH36_562g00035 [Paralvinella palmiformis]|uniref:MYND-type domain-containing protein n=1 Tax=Paralvinella palmiformis TaxID=53620 RepID=A0AAD9J5X3_9ANNE|nr:hypothetical protein LSH36_562g00035 [Paralvinella palmiformis]
MHSSIRATVSACHIAVSLPYPCQQCSEVVYCSKQCQLESWPVHSVECKNLSLLAEDWVYKLGHLALLAVISAPREMLQSASVLEASDEGNTSYHRFCQLVTHEKDREPDSNIQLVTMAVYLTEVLKSVQFLKDLEEKLVCQHILHALQIVQCNGIALTQMLNTDQFHHSKPQSIGQAVCLALALANHSCDPDMELCFYGNRCIARVVKVVDTGSQLCYDYGPVFTLQGKTERKKYLQENYYFTCNCAACRNDWPLFGELNETRLTLKCQKCHQSLPLLATSDVITCKRCDEQLSVGMTLTELSKSHDEYALASKRASCGKLLEALPVLVRHLERLDSFVCEPWKEFYSCQATIKQCYRLLGAKYGQNCGILC